MGLSQRNYLSRLSCRLHLLQISQRFVLSTLFLVKQQHPTTYLILQKHTWVNSSSSPTTLKHTCNGPSSRQAGENTKHRLLLWVVKKKKNSKRKFGKINVSLIIISLNYVKKHNDVITNVWHSSFLFTCRMSWCYFSLCGLGGSLKIPTLLLVGLGLHMKLLTLKLDLAQVSPKLQLKL